MANYNSEIQPHTFWNGYILNVYSKQSSVLFEGYF